MKPLKLQTYVLLPVVFIFVLTSATLVFMDRRYIADLHNQTVSTLHAQVSQSVLKDLQIYMREPVHVIDHIHHRIETLFPFGNYDLQQINAILWNELERTENTGAIFFSTSNDEFTGYALIDDGKVQIMHSGAGTGFEIQFHSVDETGLPAELTNIKAGFYASQRPWYQSAIQKNRAFWSDVFQYHAYPLLVIPYSLALRDANDKPMAVLGTNLFLGEIDKNLADIHAKRDIHVFILDENDMLISSSRERSVPSSEEEFVQTSLSREVKLAEKFRSELNLIGPRQRKTISKGTPLQIAFNGEIFSVSRQVFENESGIIWRVYSVVKPDDLAASNLGTMPIVYYSLAIVILGSVLIFILVRRAMKPIAELSSYMDGIAQSPEEIGRLAPEQNQKHAVTLETKVLFTSFKNVSSKVRSLIRQQEGYIEDNKNVIKELNRFARIAAETDNMVVVTDHSRRITWVNEGFTRMTGYFKEESIGKSPGQLLGGENTDPETVNVIRKALELDEPVSARILNYRKNGQPYWAELSIRPLLNADGDVTEYFSIQRDITPQMRYESELAKWKTIFQGANWGILFSEGEQDSNLIEVNPMLARMFGYEEHEMIGLPATSLLANDGEDTVQRALIALKNNDYVTFETNMLKKNGEPFPGLISLSNIDGEFGRKLRLGNIQDLSQIKSLETQLYQAQKLESIGLMTSNLVHDFNNMLAKILANSELGELRLLNKTKVNWDELERIFQANIFAAKKASEMVRQFLQFTRNDGINNRVVDIYSVIQSVKKMLPKNYFNDVNFVMPDGETQLYTIGNFGQLEQVFMNLVNNAFYAISGVENPHISIDLSVVEKSTKTKSGEVLGAEFVQVTISDNGPGIAQELRDKVFTPLFSTKEKAEGTGLGLSIVKNIIEAHDGLIEFESRPGETKFCVYMKRYFPEQKKEVSEEKEDSAAHDFQHSGHTKNSHVLLVDDEEGITTYLEAILREHGFPFVSSLNDPWQAKTLLAKPDNDIDILITDLSMPGLSGAELIEFAKGFNEELKVIVGTGYLSDEELGKLKQIQADLVLEKPVSSATLLQEIENLM